MLPNRAPPMAMCGRCLGRKWLAPSLQPRKRVNDRYARPHMERTPSSSLSIPACDTPFPKLFLLSLQCPTRCTYILYTTPQQTSIFKPQHYLPHSDAPTQQRAATPDALQSIQVLPRACRFARYTRRDRYTTTTIIDTTLAAVSRCHREHHH
jgi:hypothetical protein